MGTRAAIYARISLDKRGDELGVQRQEEACREFAHAKGYEVVGTYIDNDASAYSGAPRPEFERLMDDAGRSFDAIIVWSADRLYRRMRDLERIVDALNESGVPVRTVKSGDIDLSTADGRVTARILGSLAQRESEKMAERIAEKNRQRAKEGRSRSSIRLFGYEVDGSIREDEAAGVRYAFDALLRGMSLSGIAREMTAKGWTTVTGGEIRQPKVSEWLRNPRYVGDSVHRGEVVSHDGAAIIEREVWDKAQALLSDPARRPKQGRPHSTLMGGLYTCGECGRKLTSGSSNNNKGNRLETYQCPRKHVNRSRKWMDNFARTLLARYLADNAAVIAEHSRREDGTVPLRAQVAGLEEQAQALADLLAAGTLSAQDYATAVAAVRERISLLEAQIAEQSGMTATSEVLGAEDIAAAVHAMNREEFRALWTELIAKAELMPKVQYPDVSWRI